MTTAPFLQITSPYHNGSTYSSLNKTSGRPVPSTSLYETCDAAPPNTLDFAGSQNFTMQMWTYPKDSGISIDLGWCAAAFFLLSFLFQAGLELISRIEYFKDLDYSVMFDNNNASDYDHYKAMRDAEFSEDVQTFSDLLKVELRFNWLRFIEYTFSGSLVLVTIALLAGIVDIELLVCIFFLAATCMLSGLVAELALRVRYALQKMVNFMTKMCRSPLGSYSKPYDEMITLFDNILKKLSLCFRISHFIAWMGLFVCWGIIIAHYALWWQTCEAESLGISDALVNMVLGRKSTDAVDANAQDVQDARRRSPPDFVLVSFFHCIGFLFIFSFAVLWDLTLNLQVIIILECIIYLIFGVVQLVQWFNPDGYRQIEFTYIFLSLFAKGSLGIILFATVMFT
jgi:hypothetical protein